MNIWQTLVALIAIYFTLKWYAWFRTLYMCNPENKEKPGQKKTRAIARYQRPRKHERQ